jgi:chitinase domain-containing protein 1
MPTEVRKRVPESAGSSRGNGTHNGAAKKRSRPEEGSGGRHRSLFFLLPSAALAVGALLTILLGPECIPGLLSFGLISGSGGAFGSVKDSHLLAHVLKDHDRQGRKVPHRAMKTFPRPVLAYVTPWNPHGYDIAKDFAGMFTHVAPVWFQARRTGEKAYVIEGEHNVDAGWIHDVRRDVEGRRAHLVPRMIMEGMTQDDYMALFTSIDEQMELAKEVTIMCQRHAVDGIVLELWSRLAVGPQLRPVLHGLIKTLGNTLHENGLLLVLVVPPVADSFGADDLHKLAAHVDLFSINTYDYSPPTTAGPNAPYDWVKDTLTALKPTEEQRAQLLLGLNFYGNIYGPSGGTPIVGSQYLNVLRTHGEKGVQVAYNDRAREHLMRFTSAEGYQATLYYPTQRSIAERVALAKELGSGISMWEIGQGLDHFYDEL